MISRSEILDFAREFGLSANTVEKDYVLGWLLAGIFNHSDIAENWVFKGGTCLKKCFFETYRFSEDLDFTLLKSEHLSEQFLLKTFAVVSDWVYSEAGIELPVPECRFEIYTNPRGQVAGEGRVGYRGPLQNRGDLPRIKLDLTADERLVQKPVMRDVHHPYSDAPADGIQALTYCYEEIFAEKLRALAERERPRDLYDVVHLHHRTETSTDRGLVLSILKNKCEFKGIALPTMTTLERQPERAEVEADWEHMLGHQLPALPPFDQFWAELVHVFAWLNEAEERPVIASYPLPANVDLTWRPPAMAQAWRVQVPLEVIRFAAANHLCVDLRYEGSSRLIEPYSLRRTQAGNLVLYAIRHDSNEHRSYRVDRIDGASVTGVPFVPKYEIELSPVAADMSGLRSVPRSTLSSSSRTPFPRSNTRTAQYGPTYLIQCSVCGKRFSRRSYDTTLYKHKNQGGSPCYGRLGYLVDTRY
jgi:predicted nucleotidyltransferase component of viral defense system